MKNDKKKNTMATLKKLCIIFFIIALFSQITKAQEQQQQNQTMYSQDEIQVIGIYAHWIISMCSQNCERYQLAVYDLTKPLDCFKLHTTNQTAYAKGKFVQVKELPTVAGPNAKIENPDGKIQVTKLQVSESKKIDFPELSITPSEARKFNEKKAYSLQLTFKNPVKEQLVIKTRVGSNNQFQQIQLPPSGTQTIEYQIPATVRHEYPEILVVNDFFDPDSSKENISRAQANGFLIFVKKTVRIRNLIEE